LNLNSVISNPAVAMVGYAAACLTTFCFLPQLVHTFRTKSVDDLHVGAMVLFDLGLALWLVYGIYLHSWPMILANTVTLAFQLVLLGLKVRYNGKSGSPSRHRGIED
jgi:MtN3 and saliva related transmembrane protein